MTSPETRLIPTGVCWCGCRTQVGLGSFFAPGHDKKAESALLAVYGGSVPQLLHHHGFGPDKPVIAAAVENGHWVPCTHPGCPYLGTRRNLAKHLRTHHTSEEGS